MTEYREDLRKEVSTLTQIPFMTLQKLSDLQTDIIAHLVAEKREQGETFVHVDIGFGCLRITFMEDSIIYKFIPNKTLKEEVLSASLNGNSPLVNRAEDSLAKRIKETYRELL